MKGMQFKFKVEVYLKSGEVHKDYFYSRKSDINEAIANGKELFIKQFGAESVDFVVMHFMRMVQYRG